MATGLRIVQHLKRLSAMLMVALVAGCGGGGGDSPCVDNPNRDPRLPGCTSSGNPPIATLPSVTVAIKDAAGNLVNEVSPASPAYVEARVVDTEGNPAPNVVVNFVTTDATGGFSPPSGTALSDGNGVARVLLLAGSKVGAYTVVAATEGSAGVAIWSDGRFMVVLKGQASMGYAVNISNLPASTTGSIKFIGADTTNIALKGTGGIGRQEFSTLTFQVFDQTGHPIQRAPVNFVLNTTVGGLSLQPQSALTDANGLVATVVSSGTIPTPIVTVTASVANSGVTTVSNVLVVSTGLAINNRMSGSVDIGNFEGWDVDGECTNVTLRMGDHFGNPVPDGTAANFTTSHGIIHASCLTGTAVGVTTPPGQSTNSIISGVAGHCSVRYCSAGSRPPRGRAVVLGYARGEEDFFDANGNNVCDGCTNTSGQEFSRAHDLWPDIFRDDNEDGSWTSGEPCIGPNLNARCSTSPDGTYNGVLASPKIPSAQQTTYLGRQYVAIWSGSHARISASQVSYCAGFSPSGSGTATVRIGVVDVNGNPMPAETRVVVTGPGSGSFVVGNYVIGIGQQFGNAPGQVPIEVYDVSVPCASIPAGNPMEITVITPRKIVSRMQYTVQ
jgi:hypothetical protein